MANGALFWLSAQMNGLPHKHIYTRTNAHTHRWAKLNWKSNEIALSMCNMDAIEWIENGQFSVHNCCRIFLLAIYNGILIAIDIMMMWLWARVDNTHSKQYTFFGNTETVNEINDFNCKMKNI